MRFQAVPENSGKKRSISHIEKKDCEGLPQLVHNHEEPSASQMSQAH